MPNEKLINWISQNGFEIIEDEKLSSKFPFRPDILGQNEDNVQAYFIRKSDSIPETYLQRLSLLKLSGLIVEIIIAFSKQPSESTISLCSRYGVGVLSIGRRSCSLIQEAQKKGAATKVAARAPKMTQLDLFFSSKQDLIERNIGIDILDLIRNSMHKPIYPKLVEKDQRYNEMSKNKLKELIELCLNEADFVVCILSNEYREIVNWEVRRALSLLEIEKVIIFLRSSKEAKASWGDLLHFIHLQYAVKGKTVKYIEYIDERDFRNVFHERIMILLENIHKQLGIPLIVTQ